MFVTSEVSKLDRFKVAKSSSPQNIDAILVTFEVLKPNRFSLGIDLMLSKLLNIFDTFAVLKLYTFILFSTSS